jgi:ABC-type phosphate/phosphonate transport system substrate-binding protein
MIDGNHLVFTHEGTLPRGRTRVLAQTARYDHCNFTVLDGAPDALVARFVDLLLSMRYDDPIARPLLDLEGLKQWRTGRTSGYAQLDAGCRRFGWIDSFVSMVAAR